MRYGRGDKGTTDLFGKSGVSKSDLRIECYGELDELSSHIGFVRSLLNERDDDVSEVLRRVQEKLFRLSSELATPDRNKVPVEPISARDVSEIEEFIERYEKELKPLKHFVYQGGSKEAAAMHVARAVARRAERRVVALNDVEPLNEEVLRFLNRLSTLFFVLARVLNSRSGIDEEVWSGRGL